jgi:hypothetical protein
MNTKKVVDKYYEAVNAGSWDTWLTLFDNNVKGDEQLAGHFEGIGVLKGAVEAIQKGYSKFLMHPQQIAINGEQACVIWRFEGANASGVPIAYPGKLDRPVFGANYFQVQNGKITYMRTIHDEGAFAPFTRQLN